MSVDDDDLRPMMIFAEKVIAAETGKLRKNCGNTKATTEKKLIAEAMFNEYRRIANKRKRIRLYAEVSEAGDAGLPVIPKG